MLDSCYHGIAPPPAYGLRPIWPEASGPRIFAYLQPDSTTLPLIETLGKLGYPTIVRVPGVRITRTAAAFRNLTLVSEAVDVPHISQECDLAVLSGGHGTLAAVLLAGKPVVVAPIQLEQLLLARCCEQSGLGIGVPAVDVRYFANAIAKLISDGSYLNRAQAFADRYRPLHWDDRLGCIAYTSRATF